MNEGIIRDVSGSVSKLLQKKFANLDATDHVRRTCKTGGDSLIG